MELYISNDFKFHVLCSLGNHDMKQFIEQYGEVIIIVVIGVIFTFPIVYDILIEENSVIYKQADTINGNTSTFDNYDKNYAQYSKPIFTIKTENVKLSKGATFNKLTTPGVSAKDINNGTVDLTTKIKVYGEVDSNISGEYRLRYSVVNQYGMKAEARVKVIVE